MANKKISDLSSASTLSGAEAVEIVQSGSKKTTAKAIAQTLIGSNGSIAINPWSGINLTPDKFLIAFGGDSRTASNSGTDFPAIASTLPFLSGHATVVNFGVGGQLIPSGKPSSPTSQSASWTGPTNTVTLSAPNAAILPGMIVGGVIGMPFPCSVASVSGTTVTITPPSGTTYAFSTSGTATLGFCGNNTTDIYDLFVHPLRPAVSGYIQVYYTGQVGINDIRGFDTADTVIANLQIIAAKCTADGILYLPQTIISNSGATSQAYVDLNRNLTNARLRLGQVVPASHVLDASNVVSCNGTFDSQSSDGLHPNAIGYIQIANAQEAFLQSNGVVTNKSVKNELIFAQCGVISGPLNRALLRSDNYYPEEDTSSPGNGYSGDMIETGWGNASVSFGSYICEMFTRSSVAAGTRISSNTGDGPLTKSKLTVSGKLILGNNVPKGAQDDVTGAGLVLDGSMGSITTKALTAPTVAPTLTVQGTPGTSHYSYGYTVVGANGEESAMSPIASITNGNAVLDDSNYVAITLIGVPNGGGVSYRCYRTASTGSDTTLGLVHYGRTVVTLEPNAVTYTGLFADAHLPPTGTVPTGPTPGQGIVTAANGIVTTAATPATTDLGVAGQMIFTDNAIWRCFSSGDWRIAITPKIGAATATSLNGNAITTGTGTLTLGSATLNVGSGGTLASGAYTSASASVTGIRTSTGAGSTDTAATPSQIGAAANIYAGSFSATGTATATFTVSIGHTMANTNYSPVAEATNLLSSPVHWIQNKTTTTFDVVYATGLTGSIAFDWSVTPQ